MSGAIKGDFPDSDSRFAEALEELSQSIKTGEALEDTPPRADELSSEWC